ncbi:hypothetical protein BFJ63_vAg19362 [Fusarium oxysporum f. sp. narcissi]|uniref:Uncharacterized protein n=1 Tax=Fusarium oxysporum f. sp. narcissi TaxID=451672 RepID=A0A4Q2UV16_FUSOX|nr:hypothetical protein BFJ63_vAg19362 [Fusarium oxysporum f. sp. narcissi]
MVGSYFSPEHSFIASTARLSAQYSCLALIDPFRMFRQWLLPPQLSRCTSRMAELLPELAPPFPLSFMAPKRYRWTAGLVFAIFALFLFLNHEFLPQKPLELHGSTDVDWSRFAYTQYVTNSEYLCNSVMFFEALHRLSSRADRVMMYPSRMFESGDDTSKDAHLLIKARNEYKVKLATIVRDSFSERGDPGQVWRYPAQHKTAGK